MDPMIEQAVLEVLTSTNLILPIISTQLAGKVSKMIKCPVTKDSITYILNKLAKQDAIILKRVTIEGDSGCEVISVELKLLLEIYKNFINDNFDLTEEIKRKYKKLCTFSNYMKMFIIMHCFKLYVMDFYDVFTYS